MSTNTKASASKSHAPNMRFGTSFLDFKNHDKAVNDEVLMDKRTGELVYKRNSDGKFVYYTQENVHLNSYMRQLKTIIQTHRRSYIRPIPNNCEFCDDTYFMSYNIELVDFAAAEDAEKKTLIEGAEMLNPNPVAHSFTQETNGFFIELTGRPRDRATISFLTSKYDQYYKNYEGEDEDALAKKAMYKIENYDMSQAVVNYTITYYTSSDEIYARQTTDGYVRINEVSFVPFTYAGIYPRTSVAYAKIQINSISTPKLAGAMDLLKDSTVSEKSLYTRVKDYDDIAFITCNVSIYTTTTDQSFTVPSEDNCTPVLLMGWEEFEEELVNAKTGSESTGILVSVKEPDETGWEDISLWGERIRDVFGSGEEDETGAVTKLDELEKSFGSIAYHYGNFTLNVKDTDDYYVQKDEN